MPLAAGSRLGPYEIVAFIGAGGMGEVYRARDTRLDRVVAIKIAAANFTERFDREARSIAALNHPHICQIYDVGPNYLVMEYVEGSPLSGRLDTATALTCAIQICDALDAVHRRGLVHRDLKPANILVTRSGAKLLDFGLAKPAAPAQTAVDDTAALTLTQEHSLVGTLAYMSPEQAQGRELDTRSDIFSFGAVLYEMLAGQRAFPGDNAATVIAAVMKSDPPALPAIPASLQRTIRRCLAKDPDERWQTARDLAAELRWIAERADGEAAPAPSTPRVRGPVAVAATALLIIGAVATLWFLRGRAQPAQPRKFVLAIESGAKTPAISPDGTKVAYLAGDHLRIRDLSQIEPVEVADPVERISESPLAASTDPWPAWSPDSRWVVYSTQNEIRRAAASGGHSQTVCKSTGAVQSTAWIPGPGPEGTILFSVNAGSIFRVPAEGGDPVKVVDNVAKRMYDFHGVVPNAKGGFYTWAHERPIPDGSWYFVSPRWDALHALGANKTLAGEGAWSPSGYLLTADETDGLWAVKLAGDGASWTQERKLIDRHGRYPSFSASGSLLYLNSPPGSEQLAMVDRAGRVERDIGQPLTPPRSMVVAPDGQRAVLHSAGALWILDLARGNLVRVVNDIANIRAPRWTADGKRLGFVGVGKGGGDPRLMIQSADSSSSTTVHFPTFGGAEWDWSKDEETIVYSGQQQGQGRNLFSVTRGSGRISEVVATPAWEDQPTLDPSGRYVAYRSNETGRFEVYVRDHRSGSGRWLVSSKGGQLPRWSSNGTELFFLEGDSLMAVRVATTPVFRLEGDPVRLFTSSPANRYSMNLYAPMPSGQGFLIPKPLGDPKRALVLVENWTGRTSPAN